MLPKSTFLPIALVAILAISCSPESKTELTIISHNVLAYAGHPDSVWVTNEEILEEGVAFYKMHNPDILVLQEAPLEPAVATLANKLGYNYFWISTGSKGSTAYPYGFPGAILSRYKIKDMHDYNLKNANLPDTLYTRHMGSAIIETPGGPVFILATHLCANWGGRFREPTRLAEVEYVQNHVEFDHNLPLNIWAADFNFQPKSLPYDLVMTMGFTDTDVPANDHPTVPVPGGRVKIDHIFYQGKEVEVLSFEVLQMPYYDGPQRYLSDHHAVKAVLRF